MHSVYSLGIPRFTHLHRAQEHLIKTEGVCAVIVADIIRINNVEHRFAHLFNGPSADVLAVLQNEFCAFIFRSPLLKGLNIQAVISYKVNVHVYLCGLVIIFEIERYKGICVLYPVYEVGASLNHSLVYQFLERLVLTYVTQIIEELVPESGVDEVACSVLCSTNIEIYISPVIICLFAYQSGVVVRIHIPQIVGAAACKARHGALLVWITLIVPICCMSQRRLSVLGWFKGCNLRKFQRKFILIKRSRNSVFVVNWERLSPISLT